MIKQIENTMIRELTDDEVLVVGGALLGWTFFADADGAHGEWWGVDGAPIFIW
jgi:hypothetical protein